jgi:excisionase family DNA binding protein
MKNYLLLNLSELAEKRAVNMRQEAQLWDILARDLKREARRGEETTIRRVVRTSLPAQPLTNEELNHDKLFVRISEASQMMGIGRSSIYKEISASRIKVKKAGRKTLIAVSEIRAWFENLPTTSSK